MTSRDFEKFFDFETQVKISTSDGKSFTGIITGIDDDFDTASGVDEIELDVGTHYVGIEIPDIISVEPVSKTA